jgi:hypothetical protein
MVLSALILFYGMRFAPRVAVDPQPQPAQARAG